MKPLLFCLVSCMGLALGYTCNSKKAPDCEIALQELYAAQHTIDSLQHIVIPEIKKQGYLEAYNQWVTWYLNTHKTSQDFQTKEIESAKNLEYDYRLEKLVHIITMVNELWLDNPLVDTNTTFKLKPEQKSRVDFKNFKTYNQ